MTALELRSVAPTRQEKVDTLASLLGCTKDEALEHLVDLGEVEG